MKEPHSSELCECRSRSSAIRQGLKQWYKVWYLVDLSLARHKVPEGHGDGPETVAGHGLDDLVQQALLHVAGELLQVAIVPIDEGASERFNAMDYQMFSIGIHFYDG